MQLFYATRDGQSRRIAERIINRLSEAEIPAQPYDLAIAMPTPQRLSEARLIVLVAAIRYGRHLREAERFLAVYRALPTPPPLVFLSVSLVARKPDKRTPENNAYLRKAIARHRLAPVLAMAIGGRLDYARYGWLDKQIIRFIMKLTGGPTNPDACVEYTPWDEVDAIAVRIAELCGRSQPLGDASR
jgi:menaquinone-dependent protoporphyrinogen oxidase